MGDLPQLLDRCLTPEERKALYNNAKLKKRNVDALLKAHADYPGTGPQGETCGSCAHLARNRMAKTYLKCGLMEAKWTGGGGTDVRARDASCSKWEAR